MGRTFCANSGLMRLNRYFFIKSTYAVACTSFKESPVYNFFEVPEEGCQSRFKSSGVTSL